MYSQGGGRRYLYSDNLSGGAGCRIGDSRRRKVGEVRRLWCHLVSISSACSEVARATLCRLALVPARICGERGGAGGGDGDGGGGGGVFAEKQREEGGEEIC